MAPGSRSSSDPGTRSAKTRTPCTEDSSKPAAATSAVASSGVNRWPARADGRVGRVGQERQRLREVPGHRPRDDRGVPLGDQEREVATGAKHPGDRVQCCRRVVDHLEDAVAEHQVGTAGCDQVGQGGEVALLTDDLDADLAGAASQCGQGIGAGVDHGDPVAELGDPDRGDPGATADVDDVEGRTVEHGGQVVPHHGGAGIGAALAG